MAVFRPADPAQLADVVRWAVAEAQPLELLAGGTKRRLGRAAQTEHTLDLSAFAGIAEYEPAELVLTAAAATPLAEIEAAVAVRGQMLAFEPPDWRALLGTTDREPTLGGTLSCNMSGPRRVKSGAARDHLLGFAGVNGRGEPFKGGGKVVKNVTGYDMCKLVAGAYGTLAALTELSVKTLPRPATACSVGVLGLDDAAAIATLAEALNSPHEVSGAAHLPSGRWGGADRAATVLRIEGPEPSVAHRAAALRAMLAGRGETLSLDPDASAALWRQIGDVACLVEPRARAVWRISVPPAAAAGVTAAVARAAPAVWYYDWGGGLVWLACDDAAAVRGAVDAVGDGHATLIRADEAMRAAVAVFQPLPAPLAALSARIKAGFDPLGVFNPGRMTAGA